MSSRCARTVTSLRRSARPAPPRCAACTTHNYGRACPLAHRCTVDIHSGALPCDLAAVCPLKVGVSQCRTCNKTRAEIDWTCT